LITVYGYGKCSTCRKAKSIVEINHSVVIKDIVSEPPSSEELRKLVALRGEGVEPFINRRGTHFREKGFVGKKYSDDEWISLLSSDGFLIKRPIVTNGEDVIIGLDESALRSIRSKP